jgi:arginase
VHLVEPERIRKRGPRAELESALATVRALAGRAYLHIDLDVLDLAEARVNQFASPGGLSLGELVETIGLVSERFTLAAAAITAYDPDCDKDDKAVEAALAVIGKVRH